MHTFGILKGGLILKPNKEVVLIDFEGGPMRRIICIAALLFLVLISVFAGGTAETAENDGLKAAFISSNALGNDFVDLVWAGFEALEAEGWTVKCIEALDNAEYAEDIRAMAADGYQVIMTWEDPVSEVVLELADELYELYPDTHFFLLDTYIEQDHPNCTTVSVDPFESSFVAGYVAAKTTQTGTIGWIGHSDIIKIRRFRDGYIAGAAYADPSVEVVYSFTGDYMDPTKGLEAGKAMIANYPVDIIYQSCYLAGPGVITACSEAGIKCIGVDDWQGDIDPCVFWSAIKPMDNAVIKLAESYEAGETFPSAVDFNLSAGGAVFDERDLGNLSEELQAEVLELVDGIRNGSIDVYENFEEYRLAY